MDLSGTVGKVITFDSRLAGTAQSPAGDLSPATRFRRRRARATMLPSIYCSSARRLVTRRPVRFIRFMLLATVLLSTPAVVSSTPPDTAGEPVATYSILGYDADTGELGGAVQSRVFSVGNGVLWAEADVGIIATQAIVDVSYGPRGLALLAAGLTPDAVVKALWESDADPRPQDWSKQGRQFAVMDRQGRYAAFTGPKATGWAGHRGGRHCTAQGNILAGESVVSDMVDAFERTGGHLSYRLLAALDAGQAAGGDTRGMQSAAMLIVKKNGGVWLNNDVVLRLQADDSAEPLKELRRLVELAARQRDR
jgi:uncharacterized Ntn-hydrolase superfamily protein